MRNNNSVDGFIPRRAGVRYEHAQNLANRAQRPAPAENTMRTSARPQRSLNTHRFVNNQASASGGSGLSRSQIDESLRSIDEVPSSKKSKRRSKSSLAPRRKVIIKRVLIALAAILLIVIGLVAVRAIVAGNNIFKGNMLGVLYQKPLKTDAYGRSNIVIFGTAEDSEGGNHQGGNLTDSIMLLSVDQTKKDAYMLSLPRDLWVEYEQVCTVGEQGKLNAVYYCASDDGSDEQAGARALQAKVGEITGLDVQYFAHLNFTVVTEAVDAVGGVDVTIESDDPRGILDRNFDWKCNHECYYVKYKNNERVHLDGEHALALARARNAQGGYGLSNGNFDREKNQQKIMVGLRDKALSAGTLTSFGKVTGLIDALGNNLRSNFDTSEVRTLMNLGQDIPSDKIKSLTLVDEENPLVTTGSYSGQSIVRPVAGILNYADIQAYVRENVAATPVTREKAGIMILNGSDTPGLAGRQAEQLEKDGFKTISVGNAPDGKYSAVEVYKLTDTKPETAKALKNFFKVELKTTAPPVEPEEGADFVIIYGSEPEKDL